MARLTQSLPPPRVIYCDVDGTLINYWRINERVVSWLRTKHAQGYMLVLWSSRGQEHARAVARAASIDHLFEAILSKPGYILDDKGWGWTRYTRIVRGFSEATEELDCESQKQ